MDSNQRGKGAMHGEVREGRPSQLCTLAELEG
jgi:hypothetical protein